MLDFARESSATLHARLKDELRTWNKCRRWYKWLSVIQLFAAYVLLYTCSLLFHLAFGLCGGGACCVAAGDAAGKTDWFHVDASGHRTYSHTEDNGTVCKIYGCILVTAGAGCLAGWFMCYCMSWVMLGLSFIFLYETRNEDAPIEWWVLIANKDYPTEMAVYPKMNRKATKVGAVKLHDPPFSGQLQYTGWIRMTENISGSEKGSWVYCHRYGKLIFERFPNLQDAEAFSLKQQNIASETPSIPVATEVNKMDRDTAPSSPAAEEEVQSPMGGGNNRNSE